MRARFDGAPILPHRQGDGVDAVHHTLVVGDGSERIELGKAARFDDSVR
jgi:hypothetical protein